MEGIFIPKDILRMKELTSTEKMVLALYKYYTESGKYKCCSMTNSQVADELCISTWYMKKIKKHLKELGYIKTVGIKVIYLGLTQIRGEADFTGGVYQSTQGVYQSTQGVYQSTQGVYYSTQGGCTIVPSGGVPEYTHKKEKKDKKEIKKEKMTNLELLIDRLPDEYKTQERIDYIKTNYIDRLNEVDFTEGGILETWVTGIKMELNKIYPIEYSIKKEEPINNTVDVL